MRGIERVRNEERKRVTKADMSRERERETDRGRERKETKRWRQKER